MGLGKFFLCLSATARLGSSIMAGYIHDRPTFFLTDGYSSLARHRRARWYPEVWATPHAVDGISKEHLRPPSLLLGLFRLLLVLERPSSINSQGHRAVVLAGRVPYFHVIKFVDQSLL